MKTIDLVIPTIIEMQLTGKYGAVRRLHRGRQFEVQSWNHGTVCTKDGAAIAWEKLPHAVRKDAHDGFAIIKQGHEMRRKAEAHASGRTAAGNDISGL